MIRTFIILLGLFLIYAPKSYSQTVDCGYDYNCYYQQIFKQSQQEKQREREQNYIYESARLQEMQKQTALMEQQVQQSNYKDEKIQAQEDELETQQSQIDQLQNKIDSINGASSNTQTPQAEETESEMSN